MLTKSPSKGLAWLMRGSRMHWMEGLLACELSCSYNASKSSRALYSLYYLLPNDLFALISYRTKVNTPWVNIYNNLANCCKDFAIMLSCVLITRHLMECMYIHAYIYIPSILCVRDSAGPTQRNQDLVLCKYISHAGNALPWRRYGL